MALSVTPAQSEHLGRTERRSSSCVGSAADGPLGDELPDSYGHSRVVLLAVDPFHVHAYWEMTLPDRIHARELLSPLWENEAPIWVLRFYDVTSIDFDGNNARSTFDIAVSPSARNWYVELWSSDKSYFAELGPRFGEQFVPVCRSNVVRIPRSEPPPPREPEWQVMPAAPQESSGVPSSAVSSSAVSSSAVSSSAVSSVERNAAARAEQTGGVTGSHAPPPATAAPVPVAPPPARKQTAFPILAPYPRHEPKSPFGDARAFEAALRGATDGPLVSTRGVSLIARRDTGAITGHGSGGRWLRADALCTPALCTPAGGHGGSKV
jgi:hypothetical protein